MISNKKANNIKVCVTGASGFVASHILADLLNNGYTVHGTVRTLGGKSSQHLTVENLCPNGTNGELKLFAADLLTPGSFDEAMKGCTYVLHTASPFISGKATNPKTQLIEPALHGTENVLNSASKSDTVKRVVLTSSTYAVLGDNKDVVGQVVNEDNWNTSSSETHSPYYYSKTLAEKRAWEMAKDAPWDLAVINPGLVIGPTLSGRGNDGTFAVMNQLLTLTVAANFTLPCVDVRDVARAHRLAFEDKTAQGRYVAVENTYTMVELGALIRKKYPKYSSPKYTAPKPLFVLVSPMFGIDRKFARNNANYGLKIDNSKIKHLLGNKMNPIEQSLHDTIESMIETKMIERK